MAKITKSPLSEVNHHIISESPNHQLFLASIASHQKYLSLHFLVVLKFKTSGITTYGGDLL